MDISQNGKQHETITNTGPIQVMNDNFIIETHDFEESQVWKTFIYLPEISVNSSVVTLLIIYAPELAMGTALCSYLLVVHNLNNFKGFQRISKVNACHTSTHQSGFGILES